LTTKVERETFGARIFCKKLTSLELPDPPENAIAKVGSSLKEPIEL
jgi:hypothetical protein